jgi:hypothetical protein
MEEGRAPEAPPPKMSCWTTAEVTESSKSLRPSPQVGPLKFHQIFKELISPKQFKLLWSTGKEGCFLDYKMSIILITIFNYKNSHIHIQKTISLMNFIPNSK